MSRAWRQLILAPFFVVFGFALLFSFQSYTGEEKPKRSLRHLASFESDQKSSSFSLGGQKGVLLRFEEYPQDQLVSEGHKNIEFEVVSTESEVTTVECQLNGEVIPCETHSFLSLQQSRPGPYELAITVGLASGDKVSESLHWQVYENIKKQSQKISLKTSKNKNAADVIFMVDNSGTMELAQRKMAGQIGSFVDLLSGVDYRIAITTTSPVGNGLIWKPSLNYVDGKFIPVDELGSPCLRPDRHSSKETKDLLQAHLVRDLYLRDETGEMLLSSVTGEPYAEGSAGGRGIYMTYRSFERSQDSRSPESECLRHDVAKHVILLSNDRETLTDELGKDLPGVEKSMGKNLIELIEDLYPGALFKFHSIVVDPLSSEGEVCLTQYGRQFGAEYALLSQNTGGLIGSICADDYSEQLRQIALRVRDSKLSHTLFCMPVKDKNGEVMGQVKDATTGANLQFSYNFRGNKLEFSELPPATELVVSYSCYD